MPGWLGLATLTVRWRPRLPVISSRLRPISEGYNPDHHFSSLSTPRRCNATAWHPVLLIVIVNRSCFSPTSGIRALVPDLWLRHPTATFGSEKFLRIRLFIRLTAKFLFTVYQLVAGFIWFMCFGL
ncbi:hypothetical protein M9H77_14018 [Catharanthus roseus]|uniref:Uncharacterized protein n=1 Tax=Catharanthus roseus TaxID=4058 RepID=A0ACC0BLV1_CATRO|nr:hypothetical protein M9H77_14018 [Catharanthus roseus]